MDAKPARVWAFEVEMIHTQRMTTQGFHERVYESLAEARKAITLTRSEHAQIIRMVKVSPKELQYEAAR